MPDKVALCARWRCEFAVGTEALETRSGVRTLGDYALVRRLDLSPVCPRDVSPRGSPDGFASVVCLDTFPVQHCGLRPCRCWGAIDGWT